MKKPFIYLIACIALFVSCEEIIMEDDISDERVRLVAPYNGAHFFSTGITFTWEPIENGSQYQIQIARPNFDTPLEILSDRITDTTSLTMQLNLGDYQWRGRGVNSAYHTAYSTGSFSVLSNEEFQNNNLTLIAPDSNSITNNQSQAFSWQPIIGATAYQIQVLDASSSVIHNQETQATALSLNLPDGNLQWRVRATNGQQYTLYAVRNILVDTQVPNTPLLTAPANQTNTSDSNVTFQWTRTPLAGATEHDSLYIFTNSQLTELHYKNQQTSPYQTLLEEGSYFWYVKSFDQAGNQSQQSNTFSLTIN